MEKYNQQRCSCGQPAPYEMDRTCGYNSKMKRNGNYGHRHDGVDSMALALAYVPWQHWDQIYCPEEGLACGTIFPELNKPFYGKAGCRR